MHPMLLPGLGLFWTEHSERATLATWARCCKVAPETAKKMCRWQQSCDEEYIRTTRLLVEAAQALIADTIKKGKRGVDFLDEENLWEQLLWRCDSGDWGLDFMREQIGRLS